MNNLQDIIEEIKKLEKKLLLEIQKKEEEFFYKIKGKGYILKKKQKGTTKHSPPKFLRTY